MEEDRYIIEEEWQKCRKAINAFEELHHSGFTSDRKEL